MLKMTRRLFASFALLACALATLPGAITYATATKTARLQAVCTAIDAGAAAGTLQIATSTAFTTVVATITLNDPACTVSGTTATFQGFPKSDTAADNNGTAANFRVLDSNAVEIFRGTVGTSGTDMIIDNATIVQNQTVTVNSITIAHN
jgi:hypothetical protein